jgi:hypothetical protein
MNVVQMDSVAAESDVRQEAGSREGVMIKQELERARVTSSWTATTVVAMAVYVA